MVIQIIAAGTVALCAYCVLMGWFQGAIAAAPLLIWALLALAALRRPTKQPWVAAFLNIIPAGLGYLYVGRVRRFALTLVITLVAAAIGLGMIVPLGVHLAFPAPCPSAWCVQASGYVAKWVLIFAGAASPLVVVSVLTALDAYRLTRVAVPEHSG